MDNKYYCDECECSFDCELYLKNHIRNIHKENREKTVICRFCDKVFYDSQIMRKHQKQKHPDLDPKKCYLCDYVFCNVLNYEYHKRITHIKSTDEESNFLKKYECSECETFYANAYKLKRHKLSHAQEKKYKCQFCNKFFYDGRFLVKHQKTKHPKLNPKKCYICDIEYKNNSDYVYHCKQKHN